MRFAISLLSVLAIASVAGTVLRQGEPYSNYVFQLGAFWFEVFRLLGLYDVYHAWWFLAILAFLILSTGLCLYRNTPLMMREIRAFREHATEASLRHFAHQAEWRTGLAEEDRRRTVEHYATRKGYRFRTVAGEGGAWLLAAKTGGYRRLGYVFAHAALIIICAGGLLDGNLPLKLAELRGIRQPETRDVPLAQVPDTSRLPVDALAFRGNVSVSEGQATNVVFVNAGEGYYVQPLPFTLRLTKFHIEHYPTGQPKSFLSEVEIVDGGKTTAHTLAVNKPLIHKGVAIYQASFDDGGSLLRLRGWNLFSPDAKPFPFQGRVKESSRLSNGQVDYTVEFRDFRPFNVENTASNEGPEGGEGSLRRMLNATAPVGGKNVQNLGPSVRFILRDAQGQATEYDNYMLPVTLNGRNYFVSGLRSAVSEPFRYLRLPADDKNGIEGFMTFRGVMLDPKVRSELARRFAARVLSGEAVGETLRSRFLDSTDKILQIFASGGYDALARFIDKNIPAAEQEKVVQTYLKVLEGAAQEAYLLAWSRLGRTPGSDENTAQFVRDSLNAMSDSFFYGGPIYFQLESFEQVQASGFQMTRSPGRNIVYLGSLLLTLGVFVMLYVRERRLWLLVKPGGEVLLAMASNRKTLDFEKEFARTREELQTLLKE